MSMQGFDVKARSSGRGASETIYLETIWDPATSGGYVLLAQFREVWQRMKRAIESDITRLRAHAGASYGGNYPQGIRDSIRLGAQDAEDTLRDAGVFVAHLENTLVAIEDHLGCAAEAPIQRAGQEAEERQESKGST